MKYEKISKTELKSVLGQHKLWLKTLGKKGTKAYLAGFDLTEANLAKTNLAKTNLIGANLREADLDYSCMPLWCGDLKANYDDRQIIQQLYHVLSHVVYSQICSDRLKDILLKEDVINLANEFHRVGQYEKIPKKGE